MPLARDESLSPAKWPNGHRNKAGHLPPEVLFDDNFDKGLGNWRNHQGGNVTQPPISRTSLRAFDGSLKSMMLSVSGRPASGDIRSGETSTYNNLSRWVDGGKVKFETWLTLGGADLDNSPAQFMIGIDTQRWDDTSRGFYRMVCKRFPAGPDTNGPRTRENHWVLVDDKAAQVRIPAMNGNPVPPYPGDNENKMNFNYVSLTVDLDHVGEDGAKGRYYEAQIGPYVYDLTGLGAGRGKQNPQMISSVGGGPFSGGLNFGISLQNRGAYIAPGPSWLLIGRARGTWYPKAEG